MIIRVFKTEFRGESVEQCVRHMQEHSIPLVKKQPGLVACYTGRPMEPGGREFVMVTIWADLAALQRFTGERWDTPVIPPDLAHLVESHRVQHYDSFDAS